MKNNNKWKMAMKRFKDKNMLQFKGNRAASCWREREKRKDIRNPLK